jgi:uncharacterized protein
MAVYYSKGMNTATAGLDQIVEAVRGHPGLLNKSAIGLVSEVLGPSDWISGPGDDAAVVEAAGTRLVACGEALLPSFVQADPYGAGIAAVLTNVNDVAATGGVPAGIVNTIVGPEPLAREVLAGLRHAGELYDVPILGGHLTPSDGPAALSAFAVGTAREVLSVTRAEAGQRLAVACALGGAMRSDFPFYAAFEQRGTDCAGDVRTLAEVAGSGACVAAKDVSMAGLVGSLAMLLEYDGLGAEVDLDALPRPADVPVEAWLTCFPSFAFLLCVPPGRTDDCLAPFRRRGLAADVVGALDDSGDLRLTLGGRTRTVLNVVEHPATRLATR